MCQILCNNLGFQWPLNYSLSSNQFNFHYYAGTKTKVANYCLAMMIKLYRKQDLSAKNCQNLQLIPDQFLYRSTNDKVGGIQSTFPHPLSVIQSARFFVCILVSVWANQRPVFRSCDLSLGSHWLAANKVQISSGPRLATKDQAGGVQQQRHKSKKLKFSLLLP